MGGQLETDANGNLVLRPMSGYQIGSIAGMSLLLVIEYLENPSALENEGSKSIQLAVNPLEALQLAEALTKRAMQLLQPADPDTKLQ
jgi:hypothetical protein